MAITLVLKYFIAVTLIAQVISGCELTCNATVLQKRVECEPIDCPDGYVLREGKGKCGYCSACVGYKQLEEECQETDTAIRSERLYNTTECDDGLKCEGDFCAVARIDSDDCPDDDCTYCYQEREELKLKKEKNPTKSDWVWEPQCNNSGRYKPVQCKGGRCFCTQQDGKRIFGVGKAIDGTQGNMNCACSLMEETLFSKAGLNGEYDHVACQANGNYRPLQCLRDLCFCVNETTGEVDGMVLPKTLVDILPCYEESLYKKSFENPCQIQRSDEENLARYYFSKGYDLSRLTLTRCDPDGTYVPKQCNNINCYCGKPDDGLTIDANAMVPLQGELQLTMNCHCLRDRWELGPVSLQQTSCEQNGNYEPIRCVQSNCFCLDSDGQQNSTQEDIKQWWAQPCFEPDDGTSEEQDEVVNCYRKLRKAQCASQ